MKLSNLLPKTNVSKTRVALALCLFYTAGTINLTNFLVDFIVDLIAFIISILILRGFRE